jgi:hypothetical protein
LTVVTGRSKMECADIVGADRPAFNRP